MENNTTSEYTDWTLDEGLNGPIIAFFIALHLLLALPTNLFVVIHSLCRFRNFKNSAVILLFCLALSNLIMVLFYMPFVIVASGAEEWIIGGSDYSRNILCQIHGVIYEYSVTVTCHILVAISIDRSIYIVKVHAYQKIMTWKVTCGIMAAVWVS